MGQYAARPPARRAYAPEGGAIEGNAADDALMVDQGCLPSFTVPYQYDIIANLDIQYAVKISIPGGIR